MTGLKIEDVRLKIGSRATPLPIAPPTKKAASVAP